MRLEEKGEDIPALRNKPELEDYLRPYWEAFYVLTHSRQVGFGIGAIPLSEIDAYLRLYGIDDPEERDELVFFIREMDMEFLAFHNRK